MSEQHIADRNWNSRPPLSWQTRVADLTVGAAVVRAFMPQRRPFSTPLLSMADLLVVVGMDAASGMAFVKKHEDLYPWCFWNALSDEGALVVVDPLIGYRLLDSRPVLQTELWRELAIAPDSVRCMG